MDYIFVRNVATPVHTQITWNFIVFFSLTKSKFTAHFVILTTVANLVVLGLSQNSVHHAVLSTCTVCTLTLIQ